MTNIRYELKNNLKIIYKMFAVIENSCIFTFRYNERIKKHT